MPTNRTERLAILEHRQSQLTARIQREKAKLRTAERKKDTRRKIIAGALILEHAKLEPAFAATLESLIRKYVTRPDDLALFAEQKSDAPPSPVEAMGNTASE